MAKQDSSLGETIRTVVYAVLIALGIRTFAFEPFNIPSGSMIPTLLVGDFVFVSKFTYGYSRHTVALGLPVFDGRIAGSLPERGDVAVFKLPTDNRTDYIKRIIGLPGDRIQVIGGVLHLNGEAVKRERVEDFILTDGFGGARAVPQYLETLPGGRSYRIIEMSGDQGGLDDTPVYVVPEGHVFGMGDNRDNSQDSRVLTLVGFVPVENLVGKAQFLFFSLEEGTRFWEIWEWPFAIRFSRLLDGVN
ncbi:MAG TPA: signal peptidase I [Azospirillaceae bacterium]|nr:signal peptidase I [Azospirillaceae bacterium]